MPQSITLAKSLSLVMAMGLISLAQAAVTKPATPNTASKTTATAKTATKTTPNTKTATSTKTTTASTVTKKTDTDKKPAKSTNSTTVATKTVGPTTTPLNTVTPTSTAVVIPTLPEPTISTISYPKFNSVRWQGTDIIAHHLNNIPVPTFTLSDAQVIPTVMIPQDSQHTARLDVSVVDDFITYIAPKARHYPPVFASRTERYNATQRLKQLILWLDPYAKASNASYDVLLRAAKLNAYARNLDLGSDYAIRGSEYVARALKLNDSAEANFVYGVMLAEGGGFAEGSKYLEKAERMGYAEATQSLAQADLLNDNRDRAIRRLTEFKAKYPTDPYIDAQLAIINSGKYYLWDIPAAATP